MPAPLVSRWEGAESLSFSILPSPPPALSLPRRSAPLASWKASSLRKARCSLLPSDRSSHSGGLFRDPRSPTHTPAVPLPKSANPGSHPLYRGARGEPGEQTQQIAERKSVEPVPSARRPDPRPLARLSRPFRCSSQDGGQAIPGPLSTSLLQDRRRKRGSGRRDPAPACAPGVGVDTITAVPAALSPAGCRAGSGRRGGPDAIQRIPRVPLDFRGRTRPQTPGFGLCSLTRRRLQ